MPVNQKKKRRKKKKAKLGCWRDVDWPGSIEDLRFVYQREKSREVIYWWLFLKVGSNDNARSRLMINF